MLMKISSCSNFFFSKVNNTTVQRNVNLFGFLHSIIVKPVLSRPVLMPASHMEVRCPAGTWGMELLTPNPGSKSTPCPTRNPATSPARHSQPQPKHPSHTAPGSVEIIITVITNNSNNNKDSEEYMKQIIFVLRL